MKTETNTPSLLKKLLYVLSITEERELTCPEADQLLDYYTELEQRGENVKGMMPQIAHHLRICPECEEEHQALKHIIGLDC